MYSSQSLSLATLELWVHVDSEEPLFSYVAVAADIPDDLSPTVIAEADLPKTWRDDPTPDAVRDLGTQWLVSRSSVVACVPSVIVPVESNYLLNPQHPDFSRIQVSNRLQFVFDQRMWKRRK